jgi:hypothetical protein
VEGREAGKENCEGGEGLLNFLRVSRTKNESEILRGLDAFKKLSSIDRNSDKK